MTTTDLALSTGVATSNGVVRKETSYSVMPVTARAAYAERLSGASDLIPRGLFDKATGRPSPAKIFLVLEMGSVLGLEPTAALQGIDVIEGKAAISPQLMTGIIRAAGHKLRIEDTGSVRGGDYEVTVTLIRSDDPDMPISASWSLEDAEDAELGAVKLRADGKGYFFEALSDKGNALPWQKYTKDMCLWRALGRLGRRGANDILMGITYMPEELSALVGEDGTRDYVVDNVAEAELILEIKALDDKADAADLYHRFTDEKLWTPRLTAEFDAHLMTITKDSRPPRDGAPGNTGMPELDAGAGTQPTANEAESEQESVSAAPAPVPTPEEEIDAQRGAERDPAEPTDEEWKALDAAKNEENAR